MLDRVGTVLGEREGTGPDDDPLLGAQRRRSHARGHAEGHAKGHAEGHAKGRAEGHAEGRAEGRAALAQALLAARGIEISAGFAGEPGFTEVPDHAIVEAATACVSEADFLQRLRRR